LENFHLAERFGPPAHRECAEFPAMVCPFLMRPRDGRARDGGVANVVEISGAVSG
jgi:hypothetical protein